MATYYVRTRAGWLAGNSLTELAILTAGALDAGGEPRLSSASLEEIQLAAGALAVLAGNPGSPWARAVLDELV